MVKTPDKVHQALDGLLSFVKWNPRITWRLTKPFDLPHHTAIRTVSIRLVLRQKL